MISPPRARAPFSDDATRLPERIQQPCSSRRAPPPAWASGRASPRAGRSSSARSRRWGRRGGRSAQWARAGGPAGPRRGAAAASAAPRRAAAAAAAAMVVVLRRAPRGALCPGRGCGRPRALAMRRGRALRPPPHSARTRESRAGARPPAAPAAPAPRAHPHTPTPPPPAQAQVIQPLNGDPFVSMLETPVTSSPLVVSYLSNLPAYRTGVAPLLRGVEIGLAHGFFLPGPFIKVRPAEGGLGAAAAACWNRRCARAAAGPGPGACLAALRRRSRAPAHAPPPRPSPPPAHRPSPPPAHRPRPRPMQQLGPLRAVEGTAEIAGCLSAAGLVGILTLCLTLYGAAQFQSKPKLGVKTLSGRSVERDSLQSAEGCARRGAAGFSAGTARLVRMRLLPPCCSTPAVPAASHTPPAMPSPRAAGATSPRAGWSAASAALPGPMCAPRSCPTTREQRPRARPCQAAPARARV
jgi:hypothetical protein